MLKYEIIDLPIISIIGKEGLCTKEKNVVQVLQILERKTRMDFSSVFGEQ